MMWREDLEYMEEGEVIEYLEELNKNYFQPDVEGEFDDVNLAFDTAILLIREIQQYRAIGTIEECREARERQRAKKPNLYGDTRQGLDNDGNSISKEENCYECPNCDAFLGYEVDCKDENYQVDYCPHCGQALMWERDDE